MRNLHRITYQKKIINFYLSKRNLHRINVRLIENPNKWPPSTDLECILLSASTTKTKEVEIADPLAGTPEGLQKSHSKFHSQAPKTEQKKYRNTYSSTTVPQIHNCAI